MKFKAIAQFCLLTFGVILLGGCASVDTTQSLHDLQDTVQIRTGKKINWNQGTEEDRRAEKAVNDLLHQPLTADSAVQIALLNNPSLQATFEEIGLSQSKMVQAGLLKNPSFATSLRFPDSPPSLANLEFSVVQDFVDVFTAPLRKRMAAMDLEETKLRVGNQIINLATEVKTELYRLQAKEQLLTRLHLVEEINQSSADLADQQQQAGTLNELEAENLKVSQAESQAAVDEIHLEIVNSREKLNRLMGLSDDQIKWNTSPELPPLPDFAPSDQNLEDFALTQRLDLEEARTKVKVIEQVISLKKGTQWVPGGINVGVDTEKSPDGQRVTGPTLDLSLPIFDQGQADQAKLGFQWRLAREQLQSLIINARSEVREASQTLDSKRRMVLYYKTVLLPQRVKILKLTQQHYNFMLKGTYDLLQAKEREVETERSYVENLRDYWIARVTLEGALGGRFPPEPSRATPPKTPAVQSNSK